MDSFLVRSATEKDTPEMLELIRELANYENAADEVTVSMDHFVASGFGENPVWWAIVGEDLRYYSEKDNGTKVNLGINSEFEVILTGKTNSDFIWQLSKPTYFVQLQQPIVKNIKDSLVEYIFTFKGKTEGKEILTMEYSNGVESKENYELLVTVGTLGAIL